MGRATQINIYDSIREYLLGLEESGLEGLPVPPKVSPTPVTAVKKQPLTVTAESGGGMPEPLGELYREIGACKRCGLWRSRSNLAIATGDSSARLMFIGEAPTTEDQQNGHPFSGAVGQILTRMINGMGLKREQVYICNLLNCTPPERAPDREELASCRPFILQQIELVKPELIVALGTCAAQGLLNSSSAISELRGRFHDHNGIPLIVTLHPAFLLQHRHNKELFWDVWGDMVMVLERLGLPVPEKKRG